MNKEVEYTSMGNKIIHHPEVLEKLKKNCGQPISLQIGPTSKCTLNCIFCSNVNRDKDESLNPIDLLVFIHDMKKAGAKTIEWTGGGDPSLYPPINDMIDLASKLGFEQGFITNGLGFKNITQKSLDSLKWIRISMNCLDYVDGIEIPKLSENTTLGFSYVINKKSIVKTLTKLKEYVKKYKPAYVRIVPDCQTSLEEQVEHNKVYAEWVEKWGEPFFYQAKVFEKPKLCYWGMVKPFLLHDGFVYRCSSVVLNADAERSFHEKYRWCKMNELKDQYNKEIVPFVPDTCNSCVFTKQNNLVHEIIHPSEMKNFI